MAHHFLLAISVIMLLAQPDARIAQEQSKHVISSREEIAERDLTINLGPAIQLNANHVSLKPNASHFLLQDQQIISFCDLARNPTTYNQKVVRTEAAMIVGYEQSYLYDLTCNSEDTWSWVEYDRSYNPATKTQKVLDSLLNQNEGQSAGRVKVTVVGRFDAVPGKRYGHLDQFRSQFTIMNIEQVESVPPGTAWPWQVKEDSPLSKAEQVVKNLNNDFLWYYAGARVPRLNQGLLDRVLADDFTFIDTARGLKSREQFVNSIKSQSFVGEIINDNVRVQVYGATAVVTGHIEKVKDEVVDEQFEYTSKYVKRQGKWKAISLQVTRGREEAVNKN